MMFMNEVILQSIRMLRKERERERETVKVVHYLFYFTIDILVQVVDKFKSWRDNKDVPIITSNTHNIARYKSLTII